MVEQDFEEGKQVEDYVRELDALKIDDEPNSEVEQRLESVAVMLPEKQKKKEPEKKTLPTAKPLPKEEPIIESPPIVEATQQSTPIQIEKPIVQEQVPQQPQPVFSGIDDYINRAAEAVKQDWKNNAYNNLFAVFQGKAVIQPIQQEPPVQQVPQQQQVPQLTKEDLREIVREELPKFIPVQQSTVVVDEELPVGSKVVKPKEKGSVSPKVGMALVGLFVAAGIGIILLINSFVH